LTPGPPAFLGRALQVRFVVMSNIFTSDLQIHAKFDIKGSTGEGLGLLAGSWQLPGPAGCRLRLQLPGSAGCGCSCGLQLRAPRGCPRPNPCASAATLRWAAADRPAFRPPRPRRRRAHRRRQAGPLQPQPRPLHHLQGPGRQPAAAGKAGGSAAKGRPRPAPAPPLPRGSWGAPRRPPAGSPRVPPPSRSWTAPATSSCWRSCAPTASCCAAWA
jgi:hypothetical protein